MRIHPSLPWALLWTLLLAPWLALAGLGGYWLWQNQLWLPAVSALLSLYGVAWLLGERLRRTRRLPFARLPQVMPDAYWPPAVEPAWQRVEALAEQARIEDWPLSDPGRWLVLARQVIGEVAAAIKPDARRAELDVTLPEVLGIAEQVCRDVRALLLDYVPGSQWLTMDDGLRIWRWKEKLDTGYAAYQLGQMALSPLTAIPAKAASTVLGKLAGYPKAELERWLLQTLIRKTGYYAIQLYSGQALGSSSGADHLTLSVDQEAAEHATLRDQPLRLLVAGQVNAGKSSLVNALFDELRAATDVLHATTRLTPYRLQREDGTEAVIYDSPALSEGLSWLKGQEDILLQMDLILMVCAANQGARQTDATFLAALRSVYHRRLERAPPPVLVIVTHIDCLRPLREWSPPYDLINPSSDKARHIRQAIDHIAATLGVPVENIVAVSLQPGEQYNVEAIQASIAAVLPESRRAQFLRLAQEMRSAEKWEALWRQLRNSGRLLVGTGRMWLP